MSFGESSHLLPSAIIAAPPCSSMEEKRASARRVWSSPATCAAGAHHTLEIGHCRLQQRGMASSSSYARAYNRSAKPRRCSSPLRMCRRAQPAVQATAVTNAIAGIHASGLSHVARLPSSPRTAGRTGGGVISGVVGTPPKAVRLDVKARGRCHRLVAA